MEDAELAKAARADPFVWERADKRSVVVQTWSVEINAAFDDKFEQANSPEDAKHLDQMALEEFKKSMRKLFQLKDTDDLGVMSMKKKTINEKPLCWHGRSSNVDAQDQQRHSRCPWYQSISGA